MEAKEDDEERPEEEEEEEEKEDNNEEDDEEDEEDNNPQGNADSGEGGQAELEDAELNNEEPVRWKRTLAWQQVYKDRAPVIYWSSTHQTMIQGSVRGSGRFRSWEQLPRYSVEVGLRRQLRKDVPLSDLHPAPWGHISLIGIIVL
ncbi:unnamed protein product [Symbiodinium natans]|uniref:Uncharacterized protein n=1 Tax=Symbiodinium natans TaxID=878477 RepID=A0A812U0D8_9DINO|nr:unnamed protein product [Symbiodinium natans]